MHELRKMKRTARAATACMAAAAASFTILALPAAADGPTNDSFSTTQVITGASGTVTIATFGATAEPNEPTHGGQVAAASVWFAWTAPSSGAFVFNTCGSDYDTLLEIDTGATLVALTPIVSNDDACGTQSSVQFSAVAGTTYQIVVDGFQGDTGTLNIAWAPPATAPVNDAFASASTITGPTGSINGTTVGATLQAGEPQHAGVPVGHSVWYSYTPTASGTLTLDTCTNTSFDSIIAIYTGTTVNALTPVGANDDNCGIQSTVTVAVTNGSTYRVAIAGVATDNGTFTLRWSRTTAGTPGLATITDSFAGDGWVSVSWNAPTNMGASAITSYTMTATPGGATATVNAPGTRALITGLTDGTAYTFAITATNLQGAGSAAITGSAITPVSGPVDISTFYDATEIGRMQQTATYFGTTTAQAQHDCVGVIVFILGLIPPGATPIDPPPVNLGATNVTSTWPTVEQQFVTSVARKYAFSPAEAQKFSSQLVAFLLALGGH